MEVFGREVDKKRRFYNGRRVGLKTRARFRLSAVEGGSLACGFIISYTGEGDEALLRDRGCSRYLVPLCSSLDAIGGGKRRRSYDTTVFASGNVFCREKPRKKTH